MNDESDYMKLKKNEVLRLEQLILKLEEGVNVSERDMRGALNECEYHEYVCDWSIERKNRKYQKPKEIVKYQLLLKRAIFAYSKMDAYSQRMRVRGNVLTQMSIRMGQYVDRACEYISAKCHADSSLRLWLDRDPAANTTWTGVPEELPKVYAPKKTGKGLNIIGPSMRRSKRMVKFEALTEALKQRKPEDTFELKNIGCRSSNRGDYSDFIC